MKTIEEIAAAAEQATFYATQAMEWYRVDYCNSDEGIVGIRDEDTGEEHQLAFEEIQTDGGRLYGLNELLVVCQSNS